MFLLGRLSHGGKGRPLFAWLKARPEADSPTVPGWGEYPMAPPPWSRHIVDMRSVNFEHNAI